MKTRFSLKAATEDVHRALDDRLSRLNLARAEDYRQFLHVQARTVPPIEAALAAGGFGEVVEGWSKARRTEALESDLSALGDQMPCPAEMPKLGNIAEASIQQIGEKIAERAQPFETLPEFHNLYVGRSA